MYIEKMLEFLRNFSTQLACKFFTLTFVGCVHQRIVYCVMMVPLVKIIEKKFITPHEWFHADDWNKYLLPFFFYHFPFHTLHTLHTSTKLCFWTLSSTAYSASILIRPCGSLEQQQQSLRKLPQFFMLPLSNFWSMQKSTGWKPKSGTIFHGHSAVISPSSSLTARRWW